MEGRYKNPKIDTGELTLKRRLENQIFVEGLSGTKFNGIRTYFENFGEVKKVTLAYDDIGNNIHFGSVTFNNDEDAVDNFVNLALTKSIVDTRFYSFL